MADGIKFVSVSFIKMKEKEAKPVPGYFIHADDNGNPIMTDPVLIPIKQNVNERNETWKGYIKVEKAGMHYFRIDGDDVLTLKTPMPKLTSRPEEAPSPLRRRRPTWNAGSTTAS